MAGEYLDAFKKNLVIHTSDELRVGSMIAGSLGFGDLPLCKKIFEGGRFP